MVIGFGSIPRPGKFSNEVETTRAWTKSLAYEFYSRRLRTILATGIGNGNLWRTAGSRILDLITDVGPNTYSSSSSGHLSIGPGEFV